MSSCVECGVVGLTGRQRVYCSVKCSNAFWNEKLRTRTDTPCRRCGNIILASAYANIAYCSDDCRAMARRDGNREYLKTHSRKMHQNSCVSCSQSFDAKRSDSKYCSTKCWPKRNVGTRSCAVDRDRSPKVRTVKCRHCDRDFRVVVRKGGTARFCSVKCRELATYQRHNPRPEKPCRKCGKTISAGSHANKDYCSKACKSVVDSEVYKARFPERYKNDLAFRACILRNVAARRARLISNGRVEKFDAIDVLERDGWKCQLCGIDTPKSLRSTRNNNAPEVDHIVPLSAGGEHTLSNAQCVCFRCNRRKGRKIGWRPSAA